VRGVAASVALPGPSGRPSRLTVRVEVGEGGTLWWRPEPTVVARGCDHRCEAHLRLAAGASLGWHEVVVRGRHGEAPGSLHQRLRVDVAGRPLLRNDMAAGPRWPGSEGPGGVGASRVCGTAVVVGPRAGQVVLPDRPGVRAALLPLDERATMVSALSDRADAVVALFDDVLGAVLPDTATIPESSSMPVPSVRYPTG
jgi:urease accessory protein